MKSKQKLVLFGGYDYAITQSVKDLDDIWCYDINEDKWSMINIKLPIGMNSFGYSITPDQRYVIIFGGEVKDKLVDDIWIWDLQTMEFIKSELKCPMPAGFRVMMMPFDINDVILVQAWIRFNNNELSLALPMELVRIIILFCICNDIYLMQHYRGNKMCKIAIDEIIDDYTKQSLYQ